MMRKLKPLIALALVVMLTSCASTNSENGFMSVGNVSNTDCQRETRADTKSDPMLRLIMQGSNINGELINCPVNCSHGDLGVSCKIEGSKFEIKMTDTAQDKEREIITKCICRINVYFTVYDVEGEFFHMIVNDIDITDVSFKESSIVEINLRTKECHTTPEVV